MLFDARMVHYRRAGIGQYAINLLKAMARLPEPGKESRVCVLQMRSDPVPVVEDDRFRRVPVLTPPHNRFEQVGLGAELLRVELATRAQLIHCPDFVPPRLRLMPAIVNVQDLAFLRFPETALLTDESKRYYGQVPWAVHNAEALITLSHSARDDTVELLHADPKKITVIPAAAGDDFKPPIDLRVAQRAAAEKHGLPMPGEGGYILFVSTIEPRKNLPTLLEAYSLLRDRARVRPLPALAVVGREGWLFEKVHSRIDALRLNDSVRMLGEVPGDALGGLHQGARVLRDAFALRGLRTTRPGGSGVRRACAWRPMPGRCLKWWAMRRCCSIRTTWMAGQTPWSGCLSTRWRRRGCARPGQSRRRTFPGSARRDKRGSFMAGWPRHECSKPPATLRDLPRAEHFTRLPGCGRLCGILPGLRY